MIPAHNHSEYSALDGYSHPDEIAAQIEKVGAPGAFLTDHGTVAGFPAFRKAMKKKGLWVGYGMEAYQARNSRLERKPQGAEKSYRKGEDAFHLLLLAQTNKGYENLLRLSDRGHREGFHYDPRVDWDLLAEYREGIVATTACIGSLVNQRLMEDDLKPLDRLIEIFGDNLLVEVHTYDSDLQRALNEELAGLAQERGLRLIYANDAHYATVEQHDIHEVLLCAQMNEKFGNLRYAHYVDEDGVEWHHPPCLYIMDEDDVRERLGRSLTDSQVDEAIATSDWLMETNTVELEEKASRVYLPALSGDPKEDLYAKLAKGLVERYGDRLTDEIIDRAETEYYALCDAMGGLGANYFLIVDDYIRHAKESGYLVGPGRGSVGGSLVAYAIGLTNVDPIRYGLQFERFWNVGRTDGMPDIDTDFEKGHRQDMVDYVRGKYGDDKVLLIGSHVKMSPKSALRKAATVVYADPPYGVVGKITKGIIKPTDTVRAGQLLQWDELFNLDPDSFLDEKSAEIVRTARKELAPYIKDYAPMFDAAEGLSGRLSTYGVHASAVVISDVPLDTHLPARSASDEDTKDRVMVTQAEMHAVEDAGFPKFDFLGIKTLDMLKRTAKLANPDWTDADVVEYYWGLDVEDPEVLPEEYYRLIDNKQTLGLFQIDDKPGARRIGKDLQPRTIDHLAAIVALNNPGPQRSGTVDSYLARRAGNEDVTYDFFVADKRPVALKLMEILEPTYGLFVYQEQVIAVFGEALGEDVLGKGVGYSASDADAVRKMVGKRDFAAMAKLKAGTDDSLPGYFAAATAAGLTEQEAADMMEIIEEFSLYGFNKAHAVEYGTVLAWTLIAKGQWPTEFGMAGIEYNGDQVAGYVNESRARGIAVLPPDVNRSAEVISKTDEGEIIYGLVDIKGIGLPSARWVVENRPYDSPQDLLRKIKVGQKPPFNMGHFKTAMEAGAFDAFGHRLEVCTFDGCDGTGRAVRMVPKKSGDGEKRERYDCPECDALGWVACDLPSPQKRAAAEEELLGVSLTNSYVELMEKHKRRLEGLAPLHAVEDKETKETITVPGIVTEVKRFNIRSDAKRNAGSQMARVSIQWEGEELSFVAFPDTLVDFDFLLKENALGEFTLKQSPKGPQLVKGWKAT